MSNRTESLPAAAPAPGPTWADRVGTAIPLAFNLLLAALAILVIALEYHRTIPGAWLWDFGSFVESGRAAREGLNPYGIYPLTFHVVLPGFEAWNPNLNPPISALLFQAFSVVEPHQAFRAWYWISILLYVAAVALVLMKKPPLTTLVLALWAFALAGFWDTLLLGQVYIPLVLAGVIGWLLLERGHPYIAGIFIGLVVSMKPNFAVWPALLFLSGYYGSAVSAGITAGLVSLIPALVLGPGVYAQWFELLVSDTERAFFLTNASLTGLASRAGMAEVGMAVSLLLLAGSAVWAFVRRPSVELASSIGLVLSLIASPIAWVHYTLFLLPILVSKWHLSGVRIAAIVLIAPVPVVISQFGKAAWIQVTLGSIYNWAIILLLCALIAEELRQTRGRLQAAVPA